MKKLNWQKVGQIISIIFALSFFSAVLFSSFFFQIPEPIAKKESAIWHEAVTSDIELPFELESVREAVEKFFHNESKTSKLAKKDDDSKLKKV